MTTTRTKGRITGLLALTMAADVALQSGDHVSVIGDYKVGLCDGTKPILGHVSVRSVHRSSTVLATSYPIVDTTGAQVTVEARGFYVQTTVADAAIAAGAKVGIDASGHLVANGASNLGIALTTTTAAGQPIDVFVTSA